MTLLARVHTLGTTQSRYVTVSTSGSSYSSHQRLYSSSVSSELSDTLPSHLLLKLGAVWPPVGIEAIQATDLPLLNTILLLSSGATLTYSHHYLINGNRKHALLGLIITILLALTFSACQYIEYRTASFTIADGVFGSVFYMGTGFHGLHVILGVIMLSISLWRIWNYHSTNAHHLGFHTSVLYYHFVDVVWLFLFVVFYWYGS